MIVATLPSSISSDMKFVVISLAAVTKTNSNKIVFHLLVFCGKHLRMWDRLSYCGKSDD